MVNFNMFELLQAEKGNVPFPSKISKCSRCFYWWLTSVYGPTESSDRIRFWEEM